MPEGNTTELLIVDDDPLLRIDMSDRLRRRGFSVFRAGNADQAIRIMERHPSIAAVLCDLQMPGSMNGLELLREVFRRWPGRRLALISGWSSPSMHEMPPGAQYLRKPVGRADLDGVLRDLSGREVS
jgi:two-component system, response regulator PdtaR